MTKKAESPMADNNVLTAKEAAAYLRITTRTLYRLVRDRIIPASRIGRAMWRLNRTDLENYVRALMHQPFDTHKEKRS